MTTREQLEALKPILTEQGRLEERDALTTLLSELDDTKAECVALRHDLMQYMDADKEHLNEMMRYKSELDAVKAREERINKIMNEHGNRILDMFDSAMASQPKTPSNAKLIVIANYGDLALDVLRALRREVCREQD